MIRLYFDRDMHLFVDKEKTKGEDRLPFSDSLEQKVVEIAEKRFAKDRRKPDVYSLEKLDSFCLLEFIYVTAPYASLDVREEKVAK